MSRRLSFTLSAAMLVGAVGVLCGWSAAAAAADTAFSLAPTTEAYAQPSEHGGGQEEAKAGGLFTELFLGEKIYPQEKGEWYLIIEPAFAKASHEKEFELAAELIYGLTDEIQLSGEVPFVWVDPDGDDQHMGLGDISLAINYNFLQKSNIALGVRAEAILPTGDEDRALGGGQFAWSPQFLSAFRFGEFELYASVGGFFGDDDDAFLYSVAGAYPWEKFIGVLEFTGASGSGDDVLYVVPGAYWNATEKIQIGLGVPIGVTDDSDDYQIVGEDRLRVLRRPTSSFRVSGCGCELAATRLSHRAARPASCYTRRPVLFAAREGRHGSSSSNS
jgi:hypothetical protein